MQTLKKFFNSPLKIVIAICVVASILRLVLLTTVFYGPEGELYRDLQIIWKLFKHNEWPLLGPSSALGGFYFGAIYYYIEAIFVGLFNFRPYGAVFSSTLFSILSLPLLYALCRKWFTNPRIAVLAVAIQAISLFDIQNSYYASNPNYLPFFMVAFCYVLTNIIERQNFKDYVLLGLILGIGTQLHASALILMPIILIVVFIKFRIRPKVLHVVGFLLPFLICYAPYLIYEFKHQFALLKSLFEIGEGQAVSGSRLEILVAIFNFFGSTLIFKDGFFHFYSRYTGLFYLSVAISSLLALVFVWVFVKHHFRPKKGQLRDNGKFILLSWLICGLLIYLIFAPPPHFYYFIVMWPLPVFAFAWWLSSLYDYSKKYFYVIFIGFVLLQIICLSAFYDLVYKPEFSHGNLNKIFAQIKNTSNGKEYTIINGAIDINQFHYYLIANALKPINRPSRGAYMFYQITDNCEPGEGEQVFKYKKICLRVESRDK